MKTKKPLTKDELDVLKAMVEEGVGSKKEGEEAKVEKPEVGKESNQDAPPQVEAVDQQPVASAPQVEKVASQKADIDLPLPVIPEPEPELLFAVETPEPAEKPPKS